MAEINDYPVVVELPVEWGDMDAFGMVNNTIYFKYFEHARIEYYKRLNLDVLSTDRDGTGPIMAKTSCTFIRPLRYPDTLQIGVRAREIAEDRIFFEMAIFSETAGLAAIGEAVIVIFDYRTNKKSGVPDSLRSEIAKIEGNN